jgi:phosphatidylglycerophosphate synthase
MHLKVRSADVVLEAANVAAPEQSLFARARKPQPSVEPVCEYLFRPLAHLVVLALLPLRVAPPLVVASGAVTGFAAAAELARGQLLTAAVLLQLKTVLDNADGQLARASGRVSVFGRYLDSESDLLVNALLFAALGYRAHAAVLAALGFALMTLLLGINFNLKHLYRVAHGEPAETMPHSTGRAAAALERIYGLVYAPQDRLVERLSAWRIRRLGVDPRAYHDRATLAVVAWFGLSTQLLVLGIFLAADAPAAYCWLLVALGTLLVPLELRRGRRSRQRSH